MSEYFRPSRIWVGKLCYLQVREHDSQRALFVVARVLGIHAGGARVEVCVGDEVVFADIADVCDRIDGPTVFYDVPGGKP